MWFCSVFDGCCWWTGAVFGVLGWTALGRAAQRAGCWLHCGGGGLYKLLPAPENTWSLSSLGSILIVVSLSICLQTIFYPLRSIYQKAILLAPPVLNTYISIYQKP